MTKKDRIPNVVLLLESSGEYGRGLLLGIAKYASLHGPWTLCSEPGGPDRKLPRYIVRDADGIIMRVTNAKAAKGIAKWAVPTIVKGISEVIPGLPNIVTNSVETGRMAAEHLLERGFRNFAFCGYSDIFWSRDRRKGFAKRLSDAGFEVQCYERSRTNIRRFLNKEQRLMANWLRKLPKPVGLMACNDVHGRYAIETCRVAGLEVPYDVAVIGSDNDELICALCNPPLSSVAINTKTVGYEAAALLDRLMAGEQMHEQCIVARPINIVTRQSTNILATDDPYVARAEKFIFENAAKIIQVRDVVNAVHLSRRPLERRFNRVLGHSIYSEIRRTRVNNIARMLLETDFSVSQIAAYFGYSSEKHIARFFQREKGMSLTEYRKRYGST